YVRRSTKAVHVVRRALAETKSPAMRSASKNCGVGNAARRTGARIDQSLVLEGRRTGGALHVAARADTRIDSFLTLQGAQGRFVVCQALRLDENFPVPVQTQPAQIGLRLLGRSRLDTRTVNVLDAQDDLAAARPRRQPGNEIG